MDIRKHLISRCIDILSKVFRLPPLISFVGAGNLPDVFSSDRTAHVGNKIQGHVIRGNRRMGDNYTVETNLNFCRFAPFSSRSPGSIDLAAQLFIFTLRTARKIKHRIVVGDIGCAIIGI